MAKSKEKKPSRITVACNACRSRKQKCSGEKPICEQCVDHNRPCDWPEQLRRGPAKGYAEALEHRLQVTEGVLLKLLPHVSDAELATTFPDEKDPQHDAGTGYMPLARLEKKGVEEWSRFPLDTAANIRKWQRVCTGQGTIESGSRTREADRSSADGQSEREMKRKRFERSHQDQEMRGRLQSSETTATRAGSGQTASLSSAYVQTPGEYLHHTGPVHRPRLPEGRFGSPSTSNTGANKPISPRDLRSMQTGNPWGGAPSLSFQQQFLW